jgi:hypothetical protein
MCWSSNSIRESLLSRTEILVNMPRYTSPFDGAQLFYRDFVPAKNPPPFNVTDGAEVGGKPALVFLHQWPLSSRMYDPLLVSLCESHRFRCIAVDRRGFGQSDWSGPERKGDSDYSVLARDVVGLLEKIKPGPFVFIAASMGTGETVLAHGLSEYVRSNCKVCWTPQHLTSCWRSFNDRCRATSGLALLSLCPSPRRTSQMVHLERYGIMSSAHLGLTDRNSFRATSAAHWESEQPARYQTRTLRCLSGSLTPQTL